MATDLRQVVWTDDALVLLDAIIAYVAETNPSAGARLRERLVMTAESLSEFSERGRLAVKGTREITTIWPYVLRYRVDEDAVTILRVRHGAREADAGA